MIVISVTSSKLPARATDFVMQSDENRRRAQAGPVQSRINEQTPRSELPATLQRVISSGRALHFSPAKRHDFSPPFTKLGWNVVRRSKTDLFEHAPDEVRDLYSLHALVDATVGQKLYVYHQLKARDAAVWLVPEEDSATCLKDAKIYLAWFARPSVLDMTLRRSPKVFTEGLMKPFKAIVLKSSDGRDWVMYMKSDVDPSMFQLAESLAS